MRWHFIIAWRNLWRNPRRTAVILVSIVTGIWMMLFMGSLMWGMVQGMLDQALSNLTGHVQIHHPGYPDDPAIENRMRNPERLRAVLDEFLPAGSVVAWRIRVSVVAANARHSGGLELVGTDARSSMETSFLKSSAIEGGFPGPDEPNGILVGRKLLDDFETRPGHKLILSAQDATGGIASMAFNISGSFDTFLESSEKGLAFARIEAVQQFMQAGSAVSEVSILLPDIGLTGAVVDALRQRLDAADYAVTPWQDRVPMVTAYIKIWDYFSWMWGVVIFIAMGFGLVNTLLMAVYERIREFGLVRALGMQPASIVLAVLLESMLLLLVGLAAGNALALAAISWLYHNGIDLARFAETADYFGLSRVIYPELLLRDAVTYNCLVLALGLLVSLYPAWKAGRFTPVAAMSHYK